MGKCPTSGPSQLSFAAAGTFLCASANRPKANRTSLDVPMAQKRKQLFEKEVLFSEKRVGSAHLCCMTLSLSLSPSLSAAGHVFCTHVGSCVGMHDIKLAARQLLAGGMLDTWWLESRKPAFNQRKANTPLTWVISKIEAIPI